MSKPKLLGMIAPNRTQTREERLRYQRQQERRKAKERKVQAK